MVLSPRDGERVGRNIDNSVRIRGEVVDGSITVEVGGRRAEPLHEARLRPLVGIRGLAQAGYYLKGPPVRPELKPGVDEAVAVPHGDERVVAVCGGGEVAWST